VEYFGVFQRLFIFSRSFHFGVTLEFPLRCDVYCNRGINVNSILSVEKVRKDVWKRLRPAWNKQISITLYLTHSYAIRVKVRLTRFRGVLNCGS
jgi:hypothetical protein